MTGSSRWAAGAGAGCGVRGGQRECKKKKKKKKSAPPTRLCLPPLLREVAHGCLLRSGYSASKAPNSQQTKVAWPLVTAV